MTQLIRTLCSVTAVLSCLACGGGGSAPSGGSSGDPLEAYSTALDVSDAQHFLERCCFAATPKEVAKIQRIGLHAYVDEMIRFRDEPAVATAARAEMQDPEHPEKIEVTQWYLRWLLNSEQPFRERMTLFWHDRFATSHVNMSNGQRWWILRQIELLRSRALGNYRELLEELCVDPAMLFWLDGYKSTKEKPNENFAREFWELFTLGVDNGYTQEDIEQASRAFTGWRMRLDASKGQWRMVFEVDRFDMREKSVFGERGRWRPEDIVRLTLSKRPAAEAISKALFEEFCYAAPSDDIVGRLADELRTNAYDLAPTVARILKSNAFFSSRARVERVRSPLELLVGFMRSTGLEAPTDVLAREVQRLGNEPGMPPGVNGWPVGEEWLAAGAMLARYNAIHSIVTARDWHERRSMKLDALVPEDARDAPGVVASLANLLGVGLADDERERLQSLLEFEVKYQGTQRSLTPSPFEWGNARHRDQRVRGLLIALAQHPDFQTN